MQVEEAAAAEVDVQRVKAEGEKSVFDGEDTAFKKAKLLDASKLRLRSSLARTRTFAMEGLANTTLIAYDERQFILDPLKLRAAPSPDALRADALAALADPAVRSSPLFLEASKSAQRRDVLDVCCRTIGVLPKAVATLLEGLLEHCVAVANEALLLLGHKLGVGDRLVKLASRRQHRVSHIAHSVCRYAPSACALPSVACSASRLLTVCARVVDVAAPADSRARHQPNDSGGTGGCADARARRPLASLAPCAARGRRKPTGSVVVP